MKTKIFQKISVLFFTTLTCLWISIVFSILYLFPNVSIEEIIFTINNNVDKTTNGVIFTNIIPFVCCFVLSFVLFEFIHIILFKKNAKKSLLLLIAINLLVVWYVNFKLKIEDYIFADNSNFVVDNYVLPNEDIIHFPNDKVNIIHIILESMEVSYTDSTHGGSSQENLIPNLTEIVLNNESFSESNSTVNGAYVPYGASWTMGSIFAQEIGISMNLDLSSKYGTKDYLYALNSFGKILKNNGYNNYVIRGSDTNFSKANVFYRYHGDYEVYDYIFAKNNKLIPDDYSVWWGFEDEKLFAFAKEKLIDISANSKPFNFTLVTADTHSSDGYLCRLCKKDEYDSQYKTVIACSNRQVAEFVEWIKSQPFYNNTVIVITGDHLSMDKSIQSLFNDNSYQRKVLVSFINSKKRVDFKKQRLYSLFDLFPTMLSAMNVEIDGSKLGLGVDLYSNESTLIEKYGIDKFNNILRGKDEYKSNTDEENLEIETARALKKSSSIREFATLYKFFSSNNRYVSFIVSQGDVNSLLLDNTVNEWLESLGIDLVKDNLVTNSSFLAVVGGNKKVYDFSLSKDLVIRKVIQLDGTVFSLTATNDTKKASIMVMTNEMAKTCNGLNIFIYDTQHHKGIVSTCLK